MQNNTSIVDIGTVLTMRQTGLSLQQIADKIGRTKERVRQILLRKTGSTHHTLLSTQKLYRVLNLPRNQILDLYNDGFITPTVEWKTGNHHYLLWSTQVIDEIKKYYASHHRCKMCGRIVGNGRWVYCSDQCYKEGQKYRYKDSEAKKRQLVSIRKYMKKRREILGNQSNTDLRLENESALSGNEHPVNIKTKVAASIS